MTNQLRMVLGLLILGLNAACSAGDTPGTAGGADGSGPSGGSSELGPESELTSDLGGEAEGQAVDNPATCADAAASRSYVGCDFWPTVLANPVFVEFDFAVVVANGQEEPAELEVTGPDGFSTSVAVPAGGLETILLPWVETLKGPEYGVPNTPGGRLETSLAQKDGAYHMTSSVPVTAWQFNPLQYRKPKGTGEGECGERLSAELGAEGTECRAASNDASILLPSTAMTGNYRIGVYSSRNEGDTWGSVPGGFGITATQDGTTVTIETSSFCGTEIYPTTDLGPCIAAGPDGSGIPELQPGEQLTLTMDAGDVVQLVGAWSDAPQTLHADVSGSVINASAPVQVIGFNAIAQLPDYSVGNADHLEDTILPAESIGKKYIVAPPTAYGGAPIGHVVRIFGNVDGTKLSYPEGKPDGAPDTIDAGQLVQIPPRPTGSPPPECANSDLCYSSKPFVVEGDQPFVVGSFMLGGDLQVPDYEDQYAAPGDPSFSMMVTPEQFRTDYTFLAPADFTENYADILVPQGAEVTLDGQTLAGGEPIGQSGWSIIRAPLSGDAGGIHQLSTDHESGVGLQVMGFGNATSYYYPGGLDLKLISEAPEIVIK